MVSAEASCGAKLSEAMTVRSAGLPKFDRLTALPAKFFRSIIICPKRLSLAAHQKRSRRENQAFFANCSQPFFYFFLVPVVDEAEHEQHNAERQEAQNAVKGLELPNVENHNPAKGAGQHAEPEPAVNALTQ